MIRLVVIVDHYLLIGMLAGAVHPHELLALGRYIFFFQDLDVGLILDNSSLVYLESVG